MHLDHTSLHICLFAVFFIDFLILLINVKILPFGAYYSVWTF